MLFDTPTPHDRTSHSRYPPSWNPSSYCSCPAGLRGTCKHVAALCMFVIESVVKGETKACTSKPQQWGRPAKAKLHEPDLIENIWIQKIQGNCSIEEETPKYKRFDYDPRALPDQTEKNCILC